MSNNNAIRDALRMARNMGKRSGYEGGGETSPEEEAGGFPVFMIGAHGATSQGPIEGLSENDTNLRGLIKTVDPMGIIGGGNRGTFRAPPPINPLVFRHASFDAPDAGHGGANQEDQTMTDYDMDKMFAPPRNREDSKAEYLERVRDRAAEIASEVTRTMRHLSPAALAIRMARNTGGRLYREDGGPTDFKYEIVNPLAIGAQGSTTSGPIQGLPETGNGGPGDISGLLRHITPGGIMGGAMAPTGVSEPSPMASAPAKPPKSAPPVVKRNIDEYGLYSKLDEAIQGLPDKFTAGELRGMLTNEKNAVKPDEMKWSGLDEHLNSLDPKTRMTRADLAPFHTGNGPLRTKADILTRSYNIDPSTKAYDRDNIWEHPDAHQAAEEMVGEGPFADTYFEPRQHPEHNTEGDPNQGRWYIHDNHESDRYQNHDDTYPTEEEAQQAAWDRESEIEGDARERAINDVSTRELHRYMQENGYIEGDQKRPDPPKFEGRFATKGGKNYREILIQPDGGANVKYRPYEDTPYNYAHHWPDQDNIMASVRAQDMLTPEGKKALLADETQSDWGQHWREERINNPTPANPEEVKAARDELNAARTAADAARYKLSNAHYEPDAPQQSAHWTAEQNSDHVNKQVAASRAIDDWWARNPRGVSNANGEPVEAYQAQKDDPITGPIVKAYEESQSAKTAALGNYKDAVAAYKVPLQAAHEAARANYEAASQKFDSLGQPWAIPDGPYIDATPKWTDLAIKHSIYQAAKDGHDYFAWPKGETVAERYGMRNELSRLGYKKVGGQYRLTGQYVKGTYNSPEGGPFQKDYPDDSSSYGLSGTMGVGKQLAARIRAGEGVAPKVYPHDPDLYPTEEKRQALQTAHNKADDEFWGNQYPEGTTDEQKTQIKSQRRAALYNAEKQLNDFNKQKTAYFNPEDGVRALPPEEAGLTRDDLAAANAELNRTHSDFYNGKDGVPGYHESLKAPYLAATAKQKYIEDALRRQKKFEEDMSQRWLEGDHFEAGGNGHIESYNTMMPKFVTEVMRKGGHGKLAHQALPLATPNGPKDAWGIPLTPETRANILKNGFSRYARGGEVDPSVPKAMKLSNDRDTINDALRMARSAGGRSALAKADFRQIEQGRYERGLGGGFPYPSDIHSFMSKVLDPRNPQHFEDAKKIAGTYAVNDESYSGFKQHPVMPSQVKTKISDLPNAAPKPENHISWEELHKIGKGGTLFTLGGDRSNLGRLTHIAGKKLAWPVDLHAGTKYQREPNAGAVWANDAGAATALKNNILREAKNGREVFGAFAPMGTGAIDSSKNMMDALMSHVGVSDIDPEAMKDFDNKVRSAQHVYDSKTGSPEMKRQAQQKALERMAGWPGIKHAKKARDFTFENMNGNERAGLIKMMDKKKFLDAGFPSIAATRAAVTDPDLLHTPNNMMGGNIVRLDPGDYDKSNLSFEHATYSTPTKGEYIGTVPFVPRHDAMPDFTERQASDPKYVQKAGPNAGHPLLIHPYSPLATGRSAYRGNTELRQGIQPINDRMLESVQKGQERKKELGFSSGGDITKAMSLTNGSNAVRIALRRARG